MRGFPVRLALLGLGLIALQACGTSGAGGGSVPLEPVDWNAPVSGLSLNQAVVAPPPENGGTKTPQLMAREQVGVRLTDVRGPGTWRTTLDRVHRLSRAEHLDDAAVAAELRARADTLPPPWLFELSRRTVKADPREGLYWYALAQARTAYDGARCRDASVRANVAATMIDMKPVTEKARVASFDDERLYSDVLRQVREGDAITRTQASPWWICSSGRDALAAAQTNEALTRQDWLQPQSNWVEARLEAVNHVDSEIIWAENRLRQ